MGEAISTLEDMSPALLGALGVLLLVQLTLLISALVSIARRPAESLNGPKWLWVVLCLFVNIIGPIIYFLVARKPVQVDVSVASRDDQAARAESVASVLYGDGAPDAASGDLER